jgi:hypothetical protein
MATLNIGLKVNRAITAATTVNANAYAMVTYAANTNNLTISNGDWRGASGETLYNGPNIQATPNGQVCTRYFGPSQSVPASFTTTVPINSYNGFSYAKINITITWSLQGGVELINTQ